MAQSATLTRQQKLEGLAKDVKKLEREVSGLTQLLKEMKKVIQRAKNFDNSCAKVFDFYSLRLFH